MYELYKHTTEYAYCYKLMFINITVLLLSLMFTKDLMKRTAPRSDGSGVA